MTKTKKIGTKRIEPKCCPYCKSNNVGVGMSIYTGYFVKCYNCSFSMTHACTLRKDAIRSWNNPSNRKDVR